MSLRTLFSFPLLVKELTERAARPRTYWMRVLGGGLLILTFWAENGWLLSAGVSSPILTLGGGERMFSSLTWMLLAGIYLFVPAILCGVVTQEKERDSLALLLLTELRPWQIVAQKYAAGLVPALSLLLLAMPLGAVAYAYGGFSAGQLAYTLLVLVLATLQVAALAVWCSCRFRTTVAAFLGTYALGALIALIPALPVLIDDASNVHWLTEVEQFYFCLHLPPAALQAAEAHPGLRGWFPPLIVATTLLFLAFATRELPRRAFLPTRPWLREFFGRIDGFMTRVNRRVGSVVWRRKSRSLPIDNPILWRDKRARGLARPEHLVRLLLAVEIPVVLSTFSLNTSPSFGRQVLQLSAVAAGAGVVAVLVLAVTAANTFVTERVNQTLDVLLTTPLDAREIVRQKARALRRLTWVLAVPLITIFGAEAWLEESTPWTGYAETLGLHPRNETIVTYVLGAALTLAVCLPLVGWIALWVGLICRTRLRTIITTLAVILAWSVGPYLLLELFDVRQSQHAPERWLWLASPLTYPAMNELGALRELSDNAWVPLVVNFSLYGGLLGLIRWHCLQKADAYLRR